MYCEKCGNVYRIFLNKKCNFCKTKMKLLSEDIKYKYNIFLEDWSDCSDREIIRRKKNFVLGELAQNASFSWSCYNKQIQKQTGINPKLVELRKEERLKQQSKNINVTCPYCKSTNTSKITITNKAMHTAAFGVFSIGYNSKQWHCNNCKSDF